jgi:hypothetical protein
VPEARAHPDAAEAARAAWSELTGPAGYLPVLVLLMASTLSNLLVGDSLPGSLAWVVLNATAVVVTVFRSTDHRRLRRAAVALAAVVTALALLSPVLSAHARAEAGWLVLIAKLVVVAAALPLVLTRALRHRRVTLNTVCATVSAYLLIGMLFATVYRLHAFTAPPFFAQSGEITSGQYTYFSFMTLTTVGFGDLTPGSDPARAWVLLEAVVGQVFVITALARVVSLLGEERRSPR